MLHVFAYGSNMLTRRIAARVASAQCVGTGYVAQRRLAFHKRSADGSAKADAVFTGSSDDRVWGVLLAIHRTDRSVLDGFEPGYDWEEATIVTRRETISAGLYVAQPALIDARLKPYSWYHDFVLHGALENRLPGDYVETLRAVEAVVDPDGERRRRNAGLILASSRSRGKRH